MPFSIVKTDVTGVVVIQPHIYEDFRGTYKKTFHNETFAKLGLPVEYTEVSDIISKKGVIRGLHYQTKFSQAKLLHVIRGRIFDVALDLRNDSPTFGKHFEILLDSRDNEVVFIPAGFAHGFLSLDEDTIFSYESTGKFIPSSCGGILWNDSNLGINWPLNSISNILITDKDKNWPTLKQYIEKLSQH
jgi:dTDP-4-dehydrorhamnose 3,5-epimerase